MRGKLDAAAKPEVLGRYSQREAEVAEAKAKEVAVEAARKEEHTEREISFNNVAKEIAKMQAQELRSKELDVRQSAAFKLQGKAARDAMDGKPDEPMDELTERLISVADLVTHLTFPYGQGVLADDGFQATWKKKELWL